MRFVWSCRARRPGNAANSDFVIALAGNPNTGKSTLFNALTGLRQHTGNWTGKTVARSEGSYQFHKNKYKVIDLPGTYSLISSSLEEEIARNFVLFGKPDVTIIVVDATRLERNLNLVLQMLEISSRAVVCVNLIDEAEKKGIRIDGKTLSRDLGVPVVLTAARDQTGIYDLLAAIERISTSTEPIKSRTIYDIDPKIIAPINELEDVIHSRFPNLPNPKWLATRLFDDDRSLIDALRNGQIEQLYTIEQEIDDKAEDLKNAQYVLEVADKLKQNLPKDYHDKLVERTFTEAEKIASKATFTIGKKKRFNLDLFLDRIFMSPFLGYPVMFLLFACLYTKYRLLWNFQCTCLLSLFHLSRGFFV